MPGSHPATTTLFSKPSDRMSRTLEALITSASAGGRKHVAGDGSDAISFFPTRASCTGRPGWTPLSFDKNIARSVRVSASAPSPASRKRSSTLVSSARASRNAISAFGM